MKTRNYFNQLYKLPLTFISFALFLACTSSKVNAQTISIDSVSSYLGKTVTVCDKVYGTHVSNGEKKTTSLNLGADYPNSKLTIVIFEKDLPNFSYVPSLLLKDKDICVTGKLVTYKDKPQIIVSEAASITYK